MATTNTYGNTAYPDPSIPVAPMPEPIADPNAVSFSVATPDNKMPIGRGIPDADFTISSQPDMLANGRNASDPLKSGIPSIGENTQNNQNTPSQWNVTGNQTVQGQVKNIIDANSPLMQQAETRSLQQMNGRGLINSSMAVGAGQAALYDAAMPMAASDASMYGRAAESNNTAQNQFNMADKTNSFDMAKMDKSFEQNKKQLEQKFGYDTALTKMQSDSAKETADIQAKYRNLTQASASLTSLANNASDHIHQIMMNENLDAAGKQAAINSYNANLNKSMQLVGAFAGDVDLSTMLDELLA